MLKKSSIIFLILSVVYFLVRSINLTIIPIFVDEAIYTHWSQIIGSDLSQWAIPLSDGKQPLFMWIGAVFLKVIPDPLFGERLVSVLAGFATMLILYFLVKELLNKRSALLVMAIYILCPFNMMYDRLAVPDNLLTTFYILIIYLLYKFVKKVNLWSSIWLGLAIGGGMLTKSTAALAAFAAPSVLFSISKNKLPRLISFGCLSVLLGGALYYTLKLSPLFYLIKQRTPDFIFTPAEVLKHPLDPLQFRFAEVSGWLFQYLTPPLYFLCLVGLICLLIKNWRKGIFLGAFFLIPLLIEMEIAKGFTPRYFIFVSPVALIFGAYLIDFLISKFRWRVAVVLALFIPAALFEFYLLTNPEKAPIPFKEKDGYLEQWSAGYGVKEIASYLKTLPKDQPITVGTEGTQGYGTLPDGLQVYLREAKNITVAGMGQRSVIYVVPDNLISDSKAHLAFLVVNMSRMFDKTNKHLKLISSYPKSNGSDPLLLYQIVP